MNLEHYKTLLTLVWYLQRLIVLPCSLQHQVLISLKVEKTKHLFIKLTTKNLCSISFLAGYVIHNIEVYCNELRAL